MRALITGVAGQDGSYLAELLLSHGYKVAGIDIDSKYQPIKGIEYFPGSIADEIFLSRIIAEQKPDEIYNLGSISQVSGCYDRPIEAFNVNTLAVVRMLDIIRRDFRSTRFLQASSSEMYGGKGMPPFSEKSSTEPMSLYAVSKQAAYDTVRVFRQTYNLFVCNAILFNHTSPLHSPNFIIPKIIKGMVEIKLGKRERLKLGNIEVERDFGFAGDYVKAMFAILRSDNPDDYVIGTGRHMSIKKIVEIVNKKLGLSYNDSIEIDRGLVRANDPKVIYSDPSKIMSKLGWRPEKNIEDVLDMMIAFEMEKQIGK